MFTLVVQAESLPTVGRASQPQPTQYLVCGGGQGGGEVMGPHPGGNSHPLPHPFWNDDFGVARHSLSPIQSSGGPWATAGQRQPPSHPPRPPVRPAARPASPEGGRFRSGGPAKKNTTQKRRISKQSSPQTKAPQPLFFRLPRQWFLAIIIPFQPRPPGPL